MLAFKAILSNVVLATVVLAEGAGEGGASWSHLDRWVARHCGDLLPWTARRTERWEKAGKKSKVHIDDITSRVNKVASRGRYSTSTVLLHIRTFFFLLNLRIN